MNGGDDNGDGRGAAQEAAIVTPAYLEDHNEVSKLLQAGDATSGNIAVASWEFVLRVTDGLRVPIMIDSKHDVMWFEGWSLACGILLPVNVVIMKSKEPWKMCASIRECRNQGLPGLPSILALGTAEDPKIPRAIRNGLHLENSKSETVVFVVYEHTLPVLVVHPSGKNVSENTLDRIVNRGIATAKLGQRFGLVCNLSLGAMGATRIRKKVNRHFYFRDAPLTSQEIQLAILELHEEKSALLQGGPKAANSVVVVRPFIPISRQDSLKMSVEYSYIHDDDGHDLDGRLSDDGSSVAFQSDDEDANGDGCIETVPGAARRSFSSVTCTSGADSSPMIPPPRRNESSYSPRSHTRVGSPTDMSHRQISMQTIQEDEDDPFIPRFATTSQCTLTITILCEGCKRSITNSGFHMGAVGCHQGHYTCSDCVDDKLCGLVKLGILDFNTIPCPEIECLGSWAFEDYATHMSATSRMLWFTMKVEKARNEAIVAAKAAIRRANGQ